ncbi:MAG: DUF4162 domain-containing protein, partial [Thaumarchaeota archaeon]|nr:DUF4162 domain-containing protein [Nitrososphaerota archaeon]
ESPRHEQNLTLLLTTHYMDEADYIADEVIIMDKGKIVRSGTPVELKSSLGQKIFELTLEGDFDENDNLIRGIPDKLTVNRIGASSYRIELKCTDEELAQIAHKLEAAGIKIASSGFKVPTMDDVFLYYTGSSLANKEEFDERDKISKYLNKKRNLRE